MKNNEKISLGNYIIKKEDLYKDIFSACEKIFIQENFDKDNLKKIIIIEDSDKSDFYDICINYFKKEVQFYKSENIFVHGAAIYAYQKGKKPGNSNLQLKLSRINNYSLRKQIFKRNGLTFRKNLKINRNLNGDNLDSNIKEQHNIDKNNEEDYQNHILNDKIDKLDEKVEKMYKTTNNRLSEYDQEFKKNQENIQKLNEETIELKRNNKNLEDILCKLIESNEETKRHNLIFEEFMIKTFSKCFEKNENLEENIMSLTDGFNKKFDYLNEKYLKMEKYLNEKTNDFQNKIENIEDNFNIQNNNNKKGKYIKQSIVAKNLENDREIYGNQNKKSKKTLKNIK